MVNIQFNSSSDFTVIDDVNRLNRLQNGYNQNVVLDVLENGGVVAVWAQDYDSLIDFVGVKFFDNLGNIVGGEAYIEYNQGYSSPTVKTFDNNALIRFSERSNDDNFAYYEKFQIFDGTTAEPKTTAEIFTTEATTTSELRLFTSSNIIDDTIIQSYYFNTSNSLQSGTTGNRAIVRVDIDGSLIDASFTGSESVQSRIIHQNEDKSFWEFSITNNNYDDQLVGRLHGADLDPTNKWVQINTKSDRNISITSIEGNGSGQIAITWTESTPDFSSVVKMQLISEAGDYIGNEITLTDENNLGFDSDIAYSPIDDSFYVIFSEAPLDRDSSSLYVANVSKTGDILKEPFLIEGPNFKGTLTHRTPEIIVNNEGLLIGAWGEWGDVYYKTLDLNQILATSIENREYYEDEKLSLNIRAQDDPDIIDMSTLKFSWYRDGVLQANNATNSFNLSQVDVGHEVSVILDYTDGNNVDETVNINFGTILNVNDAPELFVEHDTIDLRVGGVSDSISFSATDEDLDLVFFDFSQLMMGQITIDEINKIFIITADENAEGSEVLTITASDGSDTTEREITVNYAAETVGGIQKIGGDGDDVVGSTNGNDTVSGGAGDDIVFGGIGDDILSGGTGNDKVTDSWGTDVLNGDEGNDVIRSFEGGDTINGGAGTDTIYGSRGDDRISGGDGNDVLYGDSFIFASRGNDLIDGGAGNDIMQGGFGADTFVFNASDAGSNTIERIGTNMADFEIGIDTIKLLGFGESLTAETILAQWEDNIYGNASFLSGDVSIILTGISSSELLASDFLFL